jgi:hypothetical protein
MLLWKFFTINEVKEIVFELFTLEFCATFGLLIVFRGTPSVLLPSPFQN